MCPINVGAHKKKQGVTYTIWDYGIFSMSIDGCITNRVFNG